MDAARRAAFRFQERFQPRDIFFRAGLYEAEPMRTPGAPPLREQHAPQTRMQLKV